jgi:tyrosine-protein phosphatase YwqE
MRGFVDLYCHVLRQVDDGAPTLDDSLNMLRLLHRLLRRGPLRLLAGHMPS